MAKKVIYLPLALPFFLVLLALAGIFLIFLPIFAWQAFAKLGFSPLAAFSILPLSLLGSVVNIPLHSVYSEHEVLRARIASFYGLLYPQLVRERRVRRTVIAINLGGAVIPLAVSALLMARFWRALAWKFVAGTSIVALLCYKLARVAPNVGIVMPGFIPPLASATVALLLARDLAPPLAYVSGVVGVLIGADLLNLGKVSKLGAPILSIGGAGTFDGIFLTGLISVLLV
jgi:uncharacterized membrane protein